jgi:hypothetical protein
MKYKTYLFLIPLTVLATAANLPLNPAEVKWEQSYSFDKSNAFIIEFYAKNNELMQTRDIKIYYQSAGDNFDVKYNSKNNFSETILDKKNEVAIQIYGMGAGTEPMYNAGGYKYPSAEELKQLQIVPTEETKQILGYSCKKYTYTYKKIFGEVWLTDQVTLPNDIGIFRAGKMAALHNTLSVPGFVLEMTTEDEKGGKTLMKTVSLQNADNYTVDLKDVKMSVAMNKVNYFTF